MYSAFHARTVRDEEDGSGTRRSTVTMNGSLPRDGPALASTMQGVGPALVPAQPAETAPGQSRVGHDRYFEDFFSLRPVVASARDGVRARAMVVAEVKTNLIVEDEAGFLSALSCFLSDRFERPESSVAVMLQHGVCMIFGGSLDSAYLLTLSALPVDLQAATNQRNAALIQHFMLDSLGVPPACDDP